MIVSTIKGALDDCRLENEIFRMFKNMIAHNLV
jgi:hypothetical protein